MTALIDTWATTAEAENAMPAEHAWIWREMIRAAGPLPEGARVLDIGCNQGGFLRLLHDTAGFGQGVGVDLAQEAVAIANAAAGSRPIRYLAATDLAAAGAGFDAAFSHEVVYLIDDLADHAAQVFAALKPGGRYDAVTCCHRDNPLWPTWRPAIQAYSTVPVPDHSVADIAGALRAAGFEVSIARFLAASPVPAPGPSALMPTDLDRLEVYTRWKLLFRATRPG
ncbi:MAG: methyltransferase domain-containing protein [Pseudomonadota bacterium]